VNHLDDDAELYVLGIIAPERAAEIEAHVASCETCRERVIAAEAAAAALAGALPPAPSEAATTERLRTTVGGSASRQRSWFAGAAAAAAVVLAATAAYEGSAAHAASSRLASTNTALLAMAASHFEHVSLTTPPGMVAKAIYARDGAWYYVVVSGAPPGGHVRVESGGTFRDVGALVPGTPATLFVRGVGRVAEIDITGPGDATVARGIPSY